MPTLTPIQKQQKKARDNLKIVHNRLLSAFSFKQIHTWEDASKFLGIIPVEYSAQPISFQLLNELTKKQSAELEASFSDNSKSNIVIEAIQSGEKKGHKFVKLSGYAGDTADCTVISLAVCLDISYQEASKRLAESGRHTGDGMRQDWHGEYLRNNGFTLINKETNIPLDTVRDVMCKEGRYIIANHNHAFCIKDGIVYDHTEHPDNLPVTRIYKYSPSASKPVEPVKLEPVIEEKYDADHDYGLPESSNENPTLHLYWFQKKAASEILRKIEEGRKGILLLSPTGTGKTFIAGATNRRLIDKNFADDKTFAAVPYLYVTKATIVEQTNRVFKNLFNIEPNVDTEIINIEMLRSRGGQLWLKKEVYIEQGEEKERWVWKSHRHPVAFFLDESQGAKNKQSTQSQIIYAYNDIPEDTVLICISATPFTRISEAKAWAVSTRRPLDHLGGFPKGTYLCNENWNAYAAAIASPSAPNEYNQAAVDRLMKDLEDYVVRVRGVKPQFEAKNGVCFVQFESPEKRKFYEEAWEKFLKRKSKLDALKEADEEVSNICYLLELQQFSKAAEFCHAEGFADKAFKCYMAGKAPAIAVKFKDTLVEIVRIWIEKYGISRDNITLVWGGGQTQQTEKQKQKEKILKKIDKLKQLGIDPQEFLEDMGLGDVEERKIVEYPAHYRLGAQSLEERQREIDNFQSGKSQFAIYTLKAGGVGLSLHHTDEFTTDWNRIHPDFAKWYEMIQKLPEKQRPLPGKVRRKKSGFAIEEDIPFVPVRQRETFVVVTYNAIELVQGVGRVPRLTSLTPTIQNVYCYAGTVEVQMGKIYSQKLRCLSAVVRQREDWQQIIIGGGADEYVDEVINRTKDAKDDESTLVDDEEGSEDE